MKYCGVFECNGKSPPTQFEQGTYNINHFSLHPLYILSCCKKTTKSEIKYEIHVSIVYIIFKVTRARSNVFMVIHKAIKYSCTYIIIFIILPSSFNYYEHTTKLSKSSDLICILIFRFITTKVIIFLPHYQ